MKTVVLALYAEGRTDERFLPNVIQRTAERILLQRGQTILDVLPPLVLKPVSELDQPTQADRILTAARQAKNLDVLIVHTDADYSTPDRARQDRIEPGLRLVEQRRQDGESVCGQLLAIVPVRMTEAWMLADLDALRAVIGIDFTQSSPQDLGVPVQARRVESILDPKETLNRIVRAAVVGRRRRRLDLGSVYEPLARQVDLTKLDGVPAYQLFVRDMIQSLLDLQLIR